jgi:hypothetical protein
MNTDTVSHLCRRAAASPVIGDAQQHRGVIGRKLQLPTLECLQDKTRKLLLVFLYLCRLG